MLKWEKAVCDNAPFNVEPKWFPHTHQRIITKGHPENSGKWPPEPLTPVQNITTTI